MSDDEEESYSCYNCNKMSVCGMAKEMSAIDDKYPRCIQGLFSILAENCSEFDLLE